MNGELKVGVVPGLIRSRDLVSAVLLREFEVTPGEKCFPRLFIKANTHGDAAVRWAEGEDFKQPNNAVGSASLFTSPIDVSVSEVLGRLTEARGPAKRFTLQVRFVRTYDVREAQ